MLLYADGEQTKIKTGLRIHPDQWDVEGQRAKTRGRGVATKVNGETNDDLTGMSERAIDYYGQQRRAGIIPSGAQIWEVIKPVKLTSAPVAPDAPVGSQVLADFADYIERSKAKNSPGTTASKLNTLWHLTNFCETLEKSLEYKDFTLEFKERFGDFLAAIPTGDSTIAKVLSNVKGFFSYAAERGHTTRIDTKGWGWKFKEPEIIPLTAEELKTIEGMDGLKPYLQNARSLFLLMCYTGLRYSDAIRLRPENDKRDHLQMSAKKTKGTVEVYIRKALRPILDQYFAGELRRISNPKLSEFIKELACLAGVDTPTQVTRYYKQTTIEVVETKPKYELLSCHTGRRTFVTLSIARDVPTDVLMQATGHKNFKTLQRYNQTSAARQVSAMRKAWGEED
ncbi:tyrosine-type recombinase/integrase [Microvirga sp. STS02]|uniref:tyrosine-type recombinase/integrase n=1 Tax=Hymenobacter negativus TaxID=2795026 RepID=UPI0018DD8A58|nr:MULTISPECIES: site-specific integrase [Bacteria]MBH8567331.1 tyrosine-type recombinase/integrase [Hymenobacter negativus]MBR7207063.1 tyrosine-type recombinase/integrase [Microvirga sp. STS02]